MKLVITIILSITFYFINAQPMNDEACGAIALNVTNSDTCTNPTLVTWAGATFNGFYPFATCGFTGNNKKDVWYKFIATSSSATVTTSIGSTQSDYAMSIYSAPDCNTIFTQIGCNDDNGSSPYPALSVGNLTIGSTYYIRLWAWSSSMANGELNICVNSLSLSSGKIGVGVNTPTATLDVNGSIRIRGGNPGVGKNLISDNFGNATWADNVFSTQWLSASAAQPKDSNFDNTCTRVYNIVIPQLTQDVINNKQINTYFRTGSIATLALPYISDAGGPASQINCIYKPGILIVYRHTFKSCRYNSSIPESYPGEPVMVNFPSNLEYRVVISN